MKILAISQSNYIPWKGYFDLINSVDEFILYDDMQFTKRDWRNRNQIKTPAGPLWLTIPVLVKGKFFQKISETEVENHEWAEKHWKTIQMNYSKAEYFKEYAHIIEKLYEDVRDEKFLSKINFKFLEKICEILEIKTKLSLSSDFNLVEGKTERLVDLCVQSGANEYISGPAAKDYIVETLFAEKNIKLSWMDYSNYPIYPQRFGDFSHAVTVLDLIFNVGPDFKKYMKTFE